MKHFRSLLVSLIIIALAVSLSGCGKFNNEKSLTKYNQTSFDAFDTAISFVCFCESQEEFDALFDEVNSEFIRYHQLYDIYHTYEGINNVKTINDEGAAAPVVVDKDIIDLLLLAKEMYGECSGKVNVCMGSVLKLWHNAREFAEYNPDEAYLPDDEKLLAAAEHCSMDDLIIDEAKSTVFLADPDMSLDVGAIAKGYAVERVAEMLEEKGVVHAAINAGGNVRTLGPKPDGSWRVGIQNPDLSSDEPTIATINLDGKSVVTSGVYERYFTVDGVQYHHIIDGDSLYPERRYLSVSIITKDSGRADALSTALFNMDYEVGRAYIDSLEDTEAIWVMPDNEVIQTFE